MGFWSWLAGTERFEAIYPLVTVTGRTQAEVEAVASAFGRREHADKPTVACSTLLYDQTPPRVVIHTGPLAALTPKQGRVLAHELNHVLSMIHQVPDETHVIDGGQP